MNITIKDIHELLYINKLRLARMHRCKNGEVLIKVYKFGEIQPFKYKYAELSKIGGGYVTARDIPKEVFDAKCLLLGKSKSEKDSIRMTTGPVSGSNNSYESIW